MCLCAPTVVRTGSNKIGTPACNIPTIQYTTTQTRISLTTPVPLFELKGVLKIRPHKIAREI